jgi:hypothetical protein
MPEKAVGVGDLLKTPKKKAIHHIEKLSEKAPLTYIAIHPKESFPVLVNTSKLDNSVIV